MSSRYSLGGRTVACSLASAQFDLTTPGVGLVETVDPRVKLRTVLVQSAWNVIPWPEFVAMLQRYPIRMKARALARRGIAHVNLVRAEKIVCLTHAMAEMTQEFVKREVHPAPVTLPLDAVEQRVLRVSKRTSLAVVPGTVTWYKRPWLALEWVSSHPEVKIDEVLFLGGDDGSGCQEWLSKKGRELGLRCKFGVVDRTQLYAILADATTVVQPSALESLGFGLAEALWVAERVVASPIPAHLEIASRLGAEPIWIGRERLASRPPNIDRERVFNEWFVVGRELGLDLR